jgi:hypothetical protein
VLAHRKSSVAAEKFESWDVVGRVAADAAIDILSAKPSAANSIDPFLSFIFLSPF